VNAVGVHVFRLERQHGMAVMFDRAGYIVERLSAAQADLGDLSNTHALDQQFCPDEGHWADGAGDVEKEISGGLNALIHRFI